MPDQIFQVLEEGSQGRGNPHGASKADTGGECACRNSDYSDSEFLVGSVEPTLGGLMADGMGYGENEGGLVYSPGIGDFFPPCQKELDELMAAHAAALERVVAISEVHKLVVQALGAALHAAEKDVRQMEINAEQYEKYGKVSEEKRSQADRILAENEEQKMRHLRGESPNWDVTDAQRAVNEATALRGQADTIDRSIQFDMDWNAQRSQERYAALNLANDLANLLLEVESAYSAANAEATRISDRIKGRCDTADNWDTAATVVEIVDTALLLAGIGVALKGGRLAVTAAATAAKSAWKSGGSKTVKELVGDAANAAKNACFASGTRVLTNRGWLPIEDVEVGDLAWSFNAGSQAWGWMPIIGVIDRQYVGDVVTLTLGSETLTATGNHPIWIVRGLDLAARPSVGELPIEHSSATSNGRWVEARHLLSGDVLMLGNGTTATLAQSYTRLDNIRVFNLEVLDSHTYTVGSGTVLVHNTCFSKEKQALVEMAKRDKKTGVTQADMDAYKALNKELKDPFPEDAVRGLERHTNAKSASSREPHGHVGPVSYIPGK